MDITNQENSISSLNLTPNKISKKPLGLSKGSAVKPSTPSERSSSKVFAHDGFQTIMTPQQIVFTY